MPKYSFWYLQAHSRAVYKFNRYFCIIEKAEAFYFQETLYPNFGTNNSFRVCYYHNCPSLFH